MADRARRRERHLARLHTKRERRRALRLDGVVEATRAGGGVRAPRVREHAAQRTQAAALAAQQHGIAPHRNRQHGSLGRSVAVGDRLHLQIVAQNDAVEVELLPQQAANDRR